MLLQFFLSLYFVFYVLYLMLSTSTCLGMTNTDWYQNRIKYTRIDDVSSSNSASATMRSAGKREVALSIQITDETYYSQEISDVDPITHATTVHKGSQGDIIKDIYNVSDFSCHDHKEKDSEREGEVENEIDKLRAEVF